MTKLEQSRPPGGESPPDLAAERLRAKLRAKMFQVRDAGARVGRFTIVEKIGAGGMGEVFAAEEDGSGRRVAIKVLHSAVDDNHDDGGGGAARLQREAKALARVDHPNVVGLLDVGTDNARVYLAMELVEGPTIEAWLLEASPAWTTIVDKFAQAARGLGAAHAAGLVHRDVKPANLLIGADGCVKVLDFGLARRLDAGGLAIDESQWSQTLTRPGDLMGTPGYMSPEHASSGVITARSDQFGLCVALYEALFGMRPHEGDTIPQLLQAIANGDRRRPPRSPVPSHVRDAIERGLQTDPTRRFSSMEALADALQSSGSRSRWWVAIGAVFTAAALGLGWWMRPRGERTAVTASVVPASTTPAAVDSTLGHGATVRMWTRAEAELRDASQDNATALPERITVARAALSLGRIERAQEVLQPLQTETPPSVSASVLIPMVWVAGGTSHDASAVDVAVAKAVATQLPQELGAPLELVRGEAFLQCDALLAAAAAFGAARDLWVAALPPEDSRVAWARAHAAVAEAHAHNTQPPSGLLRESLAILRPSLGNEHPRVGRTQVWLAEALAGEGDVVAARDMFAEATSSLRALGEDAPRWWAEAAASAAVFELAQGRPEQAHAQLEAVLAAGETHDAAFERWRLYRIRGEAEHALGDVDAAARSFARAADELAPFAALLGTEVLLLALARAKLSGGSSSGGSSDPAELQTRLFVSRGTSAPHVRVAVATAVATQWLGLDRSGAAISVLRDEIISLGVGADTATARAQLLLALAEVYGATASERARVSVLREARALLRRHADATPGRVLLAAEVDAQLRGSQPAPRPGTP